MVSLVFWMKRKWSASLTFVDEIANGACTLYDSIGRLYFEGYFVNGYREGRGKEYDENGNVIFDGFFKEGKRMNIVELKEMKGYWKEMNEDNEVISICKKDEEGRNEGICYFYSNGEIDRISEWKNEEELNVLKRFEGNKMIEFVNGVKRYEGEYQDSMIDGYLREGEREEYDIDGQDVMMVFFGMEIDKNMENCMDIVKWYIMEYGWNDLDWTVLFWWWWLYLIVRNEWNRKQSK